MVVAMFFNVVGQQEQICTIIDFMDEKPKFGDTINHYIHKHKHSTNCTVYFKGMQILLT